MNKVSPQAIAYLEKQAAESARREHILPSVLLLIDILEAKCKAGEAVQKIGELNDLLELAGLELRIKS